MGVTWGVPSVLTVAIEQKTACEKRGFIFNLNNLSLTFILYLYKNIPYGMFVNLTYLWVCNNLYLKYMKYKNALVMVELTNGN